MAETVLDRLEARVNRVDPHIRATYVSSESLRALLAVARAAEQLDQRAMSDWDEHTIREALAPLLRPADRSE